MALIQLQTELKMNIPNYCPKWFDISKYEETYQWGREDWAIAFEHKIYHYNENLKYDRNPDLGYDICNDCINSWQSLFLGNTDINPKTGEEWFPDKSTIKDSVLPKAILLLEAVAMQTLCRYRQHAHKRNHAPKKTKSRNWPHCGEAQNLSAPIPLLSSI